MVIREPNVLARTHDHAARNVHGILARDEHAREPVERGVRVAPAHALVQRGDHVVARVAGAVVRRRDALAERREERVKELEYATTGVGLEKDALYRAMSIDPLLDSDEEMPGDEHTHLDYRTLCLHAYCDVFMIVDRSCRSSIVHFESPHGEADESRVRRTRIRSFKPS